MSGIKVIAFDVGETLINESRIWLRWAEYLDVPPATFLGLIGAMAALDQPLVKAFEVAKPGIELEDEIAKWAVAEPESLRAGFDADDLYPDVKPALTLLRTLGYRLIIAGNQPPEATPALEQMNLPVDFIRNSAEIGAEKPSANFFQAVIKIANCAPDQIAYVGDRLDNDVIAAQKFGIHPILIRRGPWGYLHADRPAAKTVPVINSLLELPHLLNLGV